jgi:tetratricopeptide (TPR) repeat protein
MMEAEQVLEKALSLADEGEWEAMADLLRESLAYHGQEAAIHCWLGVAERELGLEGLAYERFKRALILGPEDPYVLATAGNGVAAFDDPDAEQALRTAAVLAPEVAVARLLYGAYLAREGLVKEALAELGAARDLDPDDPQIAYELGVARCLGGDMEGSVDSLAEAARLSPDDGFGRITLGLVLLETDRWEEALVELSEGAHREPHDVEAQLLAALAAGAIGTESLAYEMLERARMRASDEDVVLVAAVEERLDAGPDEARRLLLEEMAPDQLRRRLQVRP